MSYNYPFMISRHLNPRASGLIVFGGGGGDAPAAPAVDTTPEFQKTAQSFVSGAQASSDAGQDPGKWSHYENMVWSDGTEVGMIKNSVTGATQAGSGRLPQGNKQAIRDAVAQLLLTMNKPHEDWKAAKAEKEKLAKDADTATTTATDYAKNITDDVSGSAKEVQDKINTVSLELTRLKGEDQSNEAIAAQVKAKQEELVKLRRDAAAIASIEMAEQGQAAKNLLLMLSPTLLHWLQKLTLQL
jgi:Tfp pilus assembly major pilin PilA